MLRRYICEHCKQECLTASVTDHFPDSTEKKVEICDDCYNRLMLKKHLETNYLN